MLTAGILFGLFLLLYSLLVWAVIYQERELSFPHEKGVKMNVLITSLSVIFGLLALWAFLQVDWNHLLVLPQ